jgi:hypothetical protein
LVKSQKATKPGVFVTVAMRSWTDSVAESEAQARIEDVRRRARRAVFI